MDLDPKFSDPDLSALISQTIHLKIKYPTRKSVSIHSLPPEIVFEILHLLRPYYLSFECRYLQLGLVCKSWNPMIKELTYRILNLLDLQVPAILRLLDTDPTIANLIKNLFVSFTVKDDETPPSRSRFDRGISDWINIIKLLRKTRNLRALSIFADGYISLSDAMLDKFTEDEFVIPSLPDLTKLEITKLECHILRFLPYLSDSKTLDTLRFVSMDLSIPPNSGDKFNNFTFPTIQYLYLGNIRCKSEQLIQYVLPHSSSVKILMIDQTSFSDSDFVDFLSLFTSALLRLSSINCEIFPEEVRNRIVQARFTSDGPYNGYHDRNDENPTRNSEHPLLNSNLMSIKTNGTIKEILSSLSEEETLPLDTLRLRGSDFSFILSQTFDISQFVQKLSLSTLREFELASPSTPLPFDTISTILKSCQSLLRLVLDARSTRDPSSLPLNLLTPKLRVLRIGFPPPTEITQTNPFFPSTLVVLAVKLKVILPPSVYGSIITAVWLGILPNLSVFCDVDNAEGELRELMIRTYDRRMSRKVLLGQSIVEESYIAVGKRSEYMWKQTEIRKARKGRKEI
jgi:hypothetical protein